MTTELNESNFGSFVTMNEKIVIDCYADWCGGCRLLSPVIDDISKTSQIPIGKINVDENFNLTAKYNITKIPTLLFIKNGQEVERSYSTSKAEIEKKIGSL